MLKLSRLSHEPGLGVCTAEAPRARSKEFLIKKFSERREFGASFENTRAWMIYKQEEPKYEK